MHLGNDLWVRGVDWWKGNPNPITARFIPGSREMHVDGWMLASTPVTLFGDHAPKQALSKVQNKHS